MHRLPAGLTIDPYLKLNNKNYCTWRFGTKPVPLAAISPPKVRIDDRCNSPGDRDPNLDPPTHLYNIPQQHPDAEVTKIPDGTAVTIACRTSGENIRDKVGNSSRLWLGIQIPDGMSAYIPDVNIGGGYTEQQLVGLGIGRCG